MRGLYLVSIFAGSVLTFAGKKNIINKIPDLLNKNEAETTRKLHVPKCTVLVELYVSTLKYKFE